MKKNFIILCFFFSSFFLFSQAKTFLVPEDFHKEIINIIEKETGVSIQYYSITMDEFKSENVFFSDVFKMDEAVPIKEEEKKNMLLSIPYSFDYGVIISRKGETGMLNAASNLVEKKYITISGIFSLEQYMINNKQKLSYNITTKTNPFNSFSKIFKGEADFTVLPSKIADYLLQETGMKTELFVSGSPESTIMKLHYRFAVKKEDSMALMKINDMIDTLFKEGTLKIIAEKNYIPENLIIHTSKSTETPYSTTVKIINIAILTITICIFLIALIISRNSKKPIVAKSLKSQEETLAELELKRQVDEYLQGKVTLTEQTMKDPYSGLFSMEYFKNRIEEAVSRYNNFDQAFCVAIMKFKDIPEITEKMLKEAADMVQEDFSKESLCSYDGKGAFLVLFPKRTKDDAEIFAEGAEEHLERITGCSFETEVYQYGTMKHKEFMEIICQR